MTNEHIIYVSININQYILHNKYKHIIHHRYMFKCNI